MSKDTSRTDYANSQPDLLNKFFARIEQLKTEYDVEFVASIQDAEDDDRCAMFVHASHNTCLNTGIKLLAHVLKDSDVLTQAEVLESLFQDSEINPAAIMLAAVKMKKADEKVKVEVGV